MAAFRVFRKKKPPPSPSREGTGSCICLPAALTRKIKDDAAAADRQKAAPTAQIAANTKEEFEIKTAAKLAAFKIAKAAKKARQKAAKEAARRKEEVLGKVRKVLDANRNAVNAMATTYTSAEVSEVTLDTESPHVKKFVELALEASLGSGDLDIVLGYHGTSVDRAEAIVAGGFCPKKRVAPLGAYFSGQLTESYQYAANRAARFGSRGSILLVALIRDGYLGHNEFTRRPNSLRRLAGGDMVNQTVVAFTEHACLPLVHVRGVC